METTFYIIFLIAMGVIVKFASLYVLNIAGLAGALIAGKPQKRVWTPRYFSGFVVATLCQSYVYLGYTAFVVNWTMLLVAHQGASPIIIWPVAFLAVMVPIGSRAMGAIKEAQLDGYVTNAQIDALSWTVFIVLFGFVFFVFAPSIMRAIYGWVPYIGT
jgi:hypothetical protein